MRTRIESLREACRRPAPGAARRLRNGACGAGRILLALCAALAAAGCDDGDSKGAPPAKIGGVDGVLEAWKEAGLTVGEFADTDGARYGGGECQAGQVGGIDAVLCTYASPELAKAAEPKGLAVVGDATGSSLAAGRVLLVVADRRKADPEGRTINKATKVFRGR